MTERESRLQAIVLRLLQEPTQISVPVMDGPNLDERPIDEWVCQHCGNHGDAADMIKHADDCDYVAIKAALWPSDDRTISDIHVLDGMARQWSEDSKAHAETMLRLATVERERDEARAHSEQCLGVMDAARRERDEIRAALTAETSNLHCEIERGDKAVMELSDANWNLAQRDRMIDAMTNRAQELALEKMAADRRIAELEAALRLVREHGIPSNTLSELRDRIDAALSAPAQPATAAASCYCANECVCGKRYGATAPSPAAAKRVCRECHSDLHLYSHKPSCTSAVAGLTVTPEQYDAITKAIESPAAPTQALRDLFATKATAALEAMTCDECGKVIEEENAYAQDGRVFHSACWHDRRSGAACPKCMRELSVDEMRQLHERMPHRRWDHEIDCAAVSSTGARCTKRCDLNGRQCVCDAGHTNQHFSEGCSWSDDHCLPAESVNSSNRTADEQKAMERLERVARMRLNVGVNDVVDSMLVDAVEALDAARSNGAK